ncbi:MAG: BTAD domain-containing putative transcriptional regulator [Rubrimonas sp.]|uniref:BTAD domain-containing putative transcriptional regulator n=1 Tax=Rubrimonas sp. TaxID=2036015 RepID=UPI002FDEC670
MAGGSAARARLGVIGAFGLTLDGAPVALRNRKAQALLALLALSGAASAPRERLAAALWSESDAEQARQSLRQTLSDLRRALGAEADALLSIERNDVALRPGALDIDLLGLLCAIETADAPPDGVDWPGLADAILPGLDDVDPVFADWLGQRRRALVDRVADALERRMAQARDDAAGRAWALALAAFDPAHEPAARRLMQVDAARGDLRGALRRYNELWALLDEEYGAEPSPETQALAVQLKTLEPPPPPARITRPGLTLCVGEFRLDGAPPEYGYLARGFRQDLIASLTPYRDWVVIEPGPHAEAPQADGVYAIDGVAFPAADGLRLNVTLKETASRRFVWGQQDIALALQGWFDTCRLTTRRIAAALDVRVARDRMAARAGAPDVALPLYDRLLLARDLLSRFNPEEDRRAETLLRDVLRDDPGFVRARVGMAQLLNCRHIVFPGVARVTEADAEALTLARGAVEADPLDAEAQLTLGWSCAMCGRPEEATAALRAACELNPTHPRTLASAGDALVLCGAPDEGVAMADASLALDLGLVRHHWVHRASALLHSGRCAEALTALDRAQGCAPHLEGLRAVALGRLGETAQARARWAGFVAEIARAWKGPGRADPVAVGRWFRSLQPVCAPGPRAAFDAALDAVEAAAA